MSRGGGKPLTRRKLLAIAGSSAAAASALAACGGQSAGASAAAAEVDLLNDMLTLEHVQADFYEALFKSSLFTPKARKALDKFGEEEEEHIAALTKAVQRLGGEPVARPKTKFSLKAEAETLELASKLENTGAAAYLGLLPHIGNDSALRTLLSIHSVEGRHAAAMDVLVEKSSTPDGAFAKPIDVKAALASVKPYLVA
jgi:rubrerythrin